jgi:hypothetical protein
MSKSIKRVIQIAMLMAVSAGLSKPVIAVAEACSNCTSPTLCEGDKWTGYTSCQIVGAQPCSTSDTTCHHEPEE